MGAKTGILRKLGRAAGHGLDNVVSVGWKAGEYTSVMKKGAMLGAAFGGTTEWAQGGSFFRGATSGAINGALIGGASRAVKVGGTTSVNAIGSGAAGANWKSASWKQVGNNYKGYMSKPLEAMMKNKANANVANKMMLSIYE